MLTASALTTLAALKAELSLSSSAEDAYLASLIERASARLVSLCGGRQWHYDQAITEKVASWGSPFLLLTRRPVWSVASVELEGVAFTDEYYIENALAGVLARKQSVWPSTALRVGIEGEPMAGAERRLYTVVYAGGWVTPSQATPELPRTLPHDIEEAALALAVQTYRQRGRDLTIQSKKLLSASVTYATGEAASTLPAVVSSVIAAYGEVIV